MVTRWYGDDSLHFFWKCAQITGKGWWKRSKFRRRGGTLILDKTVGPGCGDTLKAWVGFGSILSGDQGNMAPGETSVKNWQNLQMTLKPVAIFGRFKVTSFIVILNHEYNSMCQKKKHFPFHWNTLMLIGQLILIWTSCKKRLTISGMSTRANICQTPGEDAQKFTLLKEKPPEGYMWSWRRLTEIQTTTRPDYVWPEVWTKIGKAAQNREKQKMGERETEAWQCSKAERDLFLDPDDKEYSEIIKNARRKLERPMAPAMPCKRDKQHYSIVKTNVEAENGPWEGVQNNENLKIALLGKDLLLWHFIIWCISFSQCHKRWRFWMPKTAVDKEWKKLETIPAWGLRKVKSKKKIILESQRDKIRGSLCFIDGQRPT